MTVPDDSDHAIELVRYDAACRAVAEAKSIDEAKDIHDEALKLKAYARQAKNRDLLADVTDIQMRAEIRVGELMEAQRQTEGLAKGGQPYQSTGLSQNPVTSRRLPRPVSTKTWRTGPARWRVFRKPNRRRPSRRRAKPSSGRPPHPAGAQVEADIDSGWRTPTCRRGS